MTIGNGQLVLLIRMALHLYLFIKFSHIFGKIFKHKFSFQINGKPFCHVVYESQITDCSLYLERMLPSPEKLKTWFTYIYIIRLWTKLKAYASYDRSRFILVFKLSQISIDACHWCENIEWCSCYLTIDMVGFWYTYANSNSFRICRPSAFHSPMGSVWTCNSNN